jgi:hypothetical protein
MVEPPLPPVAETQNAVDGVPICGVGFGTFPTPPPPTVTEYGVPAVKVFVPVV